MAVCVLGGINLDHVAQVAELPRWGETTAAHDLADHPGGKGANQAVAAARLGAVVHLLGAVGRDRAGERMLAFLSAAGVDTGQVIHTAAPTGQAFITVDDAARNMIVVAPGANALFGASQALAADLAEPRVMLTQFEATLEAIEALFRRPEAQRSIKILNTAPALAEGRSLLHLADMLVLNEAELARYAGLDAEPSDPQAAAAAARGVAEPGQTIIATLGASGVVAVHGDDVWRIPGARVEAVDTTGAGDCFCGALAAGLDQGWSLDKALAFANRAAALSVTRPGAASAMPTLSELSAAA
ncbi:ribokinase [Phenylobacterium sp.]|uniref:ribokinase n=1 Tax=Phenylobacterium sp. TaxID=1871053 RepID=UPI002FD9AEAD